MHVNTDWSLPVQKNRQVPDTVAATRRVERSVPAGQQAPTPLDPSLLAHVGGAGPRLPRTTW